MRKRPLKNIPERNFETLANLNGWRTTKRGWPDFLCFDTRSDKIIAVEVKPRTNLGLLKLLKRDQAQCLDALTAVGIKCYVSDGSTLEPYSKQRHAPEHRRRKPAK